MTRNPTCWNSAPETGGNTEAVKRNSGQDQDSDNDHANPAIATDTNSIENISQAIFDFTAPTTVCQRNRAWNELITTTSYRRYVARPAELVLGHYPPPTECSPHGDRKIRW